MINFNMQHLDMFLGVIRKYMQIRGGYSQKDLALKVNTGVSTMSRFLNQKTKELDEQLIASIVAFLDIPLHEIIDFVEEESTQNFKKLVAFYTNTNSSDEDDSSGGKSSDDELADGLDNNQTILKTTATINGVKIPFGEKRRESDKALSVGEKLKQLSPRQKGFLTDFLDLDQEGRDLIVDIGNNLIRYFKQAETDF